MAKWHDIDTNVRINGDLTLPVGSMTINGNKVWHAGNDGKGSNLNADMVDDIHGTDLLRNDQDGTLNGNLTIKPAVSSEPGLYLDLRYNNPPSNGLFIEMDGDSTDDVFLDLRANVDGDLVTASDTKFKVYSTGRVDTTGPIFINNQEIYYPGNEGTGSGLDAEFLQGLGPDSFLRSDQAQSVAGGFTVKGTLWAGSSTGDGDVVVRNSNGDGTIQLDGAANNRITGIQVYIDGNGNADLNGTLTVNDLSINSSSLINNLNAEMVGGTKEEDIAKSHSIEELGGYGVYDGVIVTQQDIPNMSVLVHSGTVYTSSGRRVTFPNTSVSLQPSSDSYDRYDLVYVEGESAGANEGEINTATGAPALNPSVPAIPSDAVLLSTILVKNNIGSILDSYITDDRNWKGFKYKPTGGIEAYDEMYVVGGLTGYDQYVLVNKPIKNPQSNTTIKFGAGGTQSYTWTHNLDLSDYVVRTSCSSPEPHVYWQNKTNNSVEIHIDDEVSTDVWIDVSLEAF